MTRSEGERERLTHSIARLHLMLDAAKFAVEHGHPVGQDAQVLMQTAAEIASQLWRLDAFMLAERDAEKR